MGVCIFLNYYYEFEDKILDSYQGTASHFFYSFLFYGFPYCFTIVLYCLVQGKTEIFRNLRFWLLAIFSITLLAINESFIWYKDLIIEFLPLQVQYFALKTSSKLSAALVYFIPVFLFWLATGRTDKTMYGFTLKNFDYRPYLIMLLIMVPLIAWASFQSSFLRTYPVYKAGTAEVYLGMSNYFSYSIFEFIYGLNFVTLELFFRGFLILAFIKYLDKGAIFAMVSVYCFLHFGKPAAETIGSVFGGAILGMISYYSRSIFGGILIHLGVAYLMDFFAGLQHLNLFK